MKERLKYEVREAGIKDIEDIVKFTQQNFPLRSNQREFFDYRFLDENSPCKLSNVIIAKHKDEIIGHRVAQKHEMIFNEKVYEAYWGTDLIVNENYRGVGVGKNIVLKMMEKHPTLFLLNIGSQNLAMHLRIGYKHFTALQLYFKPLKFRVFLSFILKILFKQKIKGERKNTNPEFPVSCGKFKLLENSDEIHNQNYNWNRNYLEGIRTKEYIKWRFFYKPQIYFFYQLDNDDLDKNKSYFVLRTILWKGMNCLLMADARYKIGSEEDKLIKQAVLKIAKENKFDGILWGTSIQQTQSLLKRSAFIKYSNMPVISSIDLKNISSDLVTHFADSDLDFNYSNSPFVYS